MPFFSENHALGTNPSPWTVNGTDLYPDSTNYLVGIGTTNPDKALHIKADDGAGHIQFEGSGNSFFASVETVGANQSQALKFSQTYWANAFFDFETDVTNVSASADLRIIADNAQRIKFVDRAASNELAVILSDKTRERLYLYGDDGFAGGMFTMDWAQTVDTRFGFGYGDEALTESARLAIAHTTDAQLVLDDLEASNNNPITITNATGTGLTFTTTNGDGSGNSALSYKFVNDRASGGSSTIQAIGDTATGLYLTNGSQGLKIDQNTANRRVRFRDYGAGNSGGCFNMEYNDSGSGTAQNFFSFGYGDEAHPYDARLNIKDAALPQLALTDGTNNTTFEQSGDELTIDVDAGKLKLDSGLSFASVSKTADYTMLASDHVVFCDCPAGTPGMTITLPANSAGRMVKIIDNAGSCSASNQIRVSPASGTINGSANVDISAAYGSVFAICDGTNWTITN